MIKFDLLNIIYGDKGDNINKLEKRTIISILIIVVIGISTDTILKSIVPNFLLSRVESFPEFMIVIYQIQATIITLGIAIVAIFSGAINETIYGISIPNFILQHRPRYLKHKITISVLIIMILVSYILISFQLYNLTVASLFITVVLILYMSLEVFSFFNGRENIKTEINTYMKNKYNNIDLLTILFTNMRNAINRDEIIKYNENFALMLDLFKKNKFEIESEVSKEFWESNLTEVFKDAFNKFKGSELRLLYNQLDLTYDIISTEFENKQTFRLWDNINREFFDKMKYFEIEDISDLYVFTSLRWKLYSCQNYKLNKDKIERNNHSIEHIFIRLYYLLKNQKSYSMDVDKSVIDSKLKDYYNYIKYDVINESKSIFKPILLNEFRQFTKVLVDAREEKALLNTFVSEINTYAQEQDDLTAHNYTMLIYIYFLAERSNTIELDLKEFASSIFSKLKVGLSDFLYMTSFKGPLSIELVDTVKKNLEWWEHIPEGEAIFNSLEGFVNQFLLFYVVYIEKDALTLKVSLSSIIQEDIFSYVNAYTGNNKKNKIELYINYINQVFDIEYTEEKANKDIDRLENILLGLYKEHEINEGISDILSEDELLVYENKLKEEIKSKVFTKFNELENHSFEGERKKRTKSIRISTYTRFLDSTLINIEDIIQSHFVTDIIRLMISSTQVVHKDVLNRDTNALNIMFDMINSYEINVDTIIGYRDWFNGYDKLSEFDVLQKSSNCIKSSRISDIVTCLDNSKFSIESLESDVTIKDINFDEYKKELEVDADGKYLYNITNDIFLPFAVEDLRKLISNTRKIIEINLDYEYAFIGDISGIAVIFKSKKDIDEETNNQ